MIYYLMDENRKNYFEVEVYSNKEKGFDLYPNVYSLNYCKHLLELQKNNLDTGIWLIALEFLEEFRGWFWEMYVPQENPYKTFDEDKARKDIKNKLIEYAKMLGLFIIED